MLATIFGLIIKKTSYTIELSLEFHVKWAMQEYSIIELVKNSSVIVQSVLALLAAMSLYSWLLIMIKSHQLEKAKIFADRFEKEIMDDSPDFQNLYNKIRIANTSRISLFKWNRSTPLQRIFLSGFMEFNRLNKPIINHRTFVESTLIESIQRNMQVILQEQIQELETGLLGLATITSTAPYVGLFGTIMGIMDTFHKFGDIKQEQITLALIAPSISEALIATALGLFVAVPSVVAYNNYSRKVSVLVTRYESAITQFLSLTQYHLRSGQTFTL